MAKNYFEMFEYIQGYSIDQLVATKVYMSFLSRLFKSRRGEEIEALASQFQMKYSMQM